MKKSTAIVISSLLATMFGSMAEAAMTDAIINTVNNGGVVKDSANGMQVDVNKSGTTTLQWNKLNIGANEQLNFTFFQQNSTAWNQISGGPSQIYGQISADGAGLATSKIILSNPSGVMFHNGSVINVNSMDINTMRPDGTMTSGSITAQGLEVVNGNLNFKTSGTGVITLDGIKFDNAGNMTATTENGKIVLANIMNEGGNIEAATSKGNIYVKSNNAANIGGSEVKGVTSDYLKLNTKGGTVNVEGVVTVGKNFSIEAKGNYSNQKVITFDNAQVTTANGKFVLSSNNQNSNLHVKDSTVDATKGAEFNSNGKIEIANSLVKGENGNIKLVSKDINLNIGAKVDNLEMGNVDKFTAYGATVNGGLTTGTIKSMKVDYSTIDNFKIQKAESLNSKLSTLNLKNSFVENGTVDRGSLTTSFTKFSSLTAQNGADISIGNRSELVKFDGNLVNNFKLSGDSKVGSWGVKEVNNMDLSGHQVIADALTLENTTVHNLTAKSMIMSIDNSTVDNADFSGGSVTVNKSNIALFNAGMEQFGADNQNRWTDNVAVTVNDSVIADMNVEGHITNLNNTNVTGTLNGTCTTLNANNTNGKSTLNNVNLGGGSLTTDGYIVNYVSGSASLNANNSTVKTIDFRGGSSVTLTKSTVNNLNSTALDNLTLNNNSNIKKSNLTSLKNLYLNNVTHSFNGLKVSNKAYGERAFATFDNSHLQTSYFNKGRLIANNSTFGALNIGMGVTYDNSDSLNVTLTDSTVWTLNVDGTSSNVKLTNTNITGYLNTIQSSVEATYDNQMYVNKISQVGGSIKMTNAKIGNIESKSSKSYSDGSLKLTDSLVTGAVKTNDLYSLNLENTTVKGAMSLDANIVKGVNSNFNIANGSYISGHIDLTNSNVSVVGTHVNNNIAAEGGSLKLRNTSVGHNLVFNDVNFDIDASNTVYMDAYITNNLTNSDITGSQIESLTSVLRSGHGVNVGFVTNNKTAKTGNYAIADTNYSGNIDANGTNAINANNRFVNINTNGDVNLNIKNTSAMNIAANNVDLSSVSDGVTNNLKLDTLKAQNSISLNANNISVSQKGTTGIIDSQNNNVILNLTEGYVQGENVSSEGRDYTQVSASSEYLVGSIASTPTVVEPSTPPVVEPSTPEIPSVNPEPSTPDNIVVDNVQNESNTESEDITALTNPTVQTGTLTATNNGREQQTSVVASSKLYIDSNSGSNDLVITKTENGIAINNDFIPSVDN